MTLGGHGPVASTEHVARQVGIDLVRLRRWLVEVGLLGGAASHGSDVELALLPGGSQNVLLDLRIGERAYVLRRPPLDAGARGDATIERETVVLGALVDSAVPHPTLVAACHDGDVIGAAFAVMERVHGEALDVVLATITGSTAVRRLGLAVVDAAAAIAAVPLVGALARLGTPVGWPERQLDRWSTRLASYERYGGYRGPAGLVPIDDLRRWLTSRVPRSHVAGLVHGDLHVDNVMFAPDGRSIAAVVDWELATIGCPLLDLAHLMATWPDGRTAPALRPTVTGLPPVDELALRYEAQTGFDLADLPWFRVLACYRLAVLLEGTTARADAGMVDAELGERFHRGAIALAEHGAQLAGGER